MFHRRLTHYEDRFSISIVTIRMSSVSEDKLKSVTIECLSKFDSLKDISLKKVKLAVAQQLKVDLEVVNDKFADQIKTIVANYRKLHGKSNDDIVQGRFSKKDSIVVQKTIEQYAKDNNIDPTEVSTFLRENRVGVNYNDLWDLLADLLPHRSKKVFYSIVCNLMQ